jgi:hypothetical protein
MENNFPEKFQNKDGTLNAGALLKSYSELEKKIGTMISVPSDDADDETRKKFNRAIGVPESADDYPGDPMFEDAPDIRERFLEIGLTKKQAESVCKMAADLLAPALDLIMSSHYESQELGELRRFFGDDAKMRAALSEINGYAEKNLSPEAYAALSSSADGIKTIYDMMKSREPAVATNGKNGESPSDGDLRRMMRDPKYWRDHDDEFVRKIESGFKKLYG